MSDYQKPRRCLIVDDVRSSREMLRSWLVRDGFEVSSAADGAEAWEAIQRLPPDFVVTDIEMPNLSGLELIRKVRAAECSAIHCIPILVMTSLHDCQILKAVQEIGGNGLLVKPLDKNVVDSVLVNLWAGKFSSADTNFEFDDRASESEGAGVISPALRRLFDHVARNERG